MIYYAANVLKNKNVISMFNEILPTAQNAIHFSHWYTSRLLIISIPQPDFCGTYSAIAITTRNMLIFYHCIPWPVVATRL